MIGDAVTALPCSLSQEQDLSHRNLSALAWQLVYRLGVALARLLTSPCISETLHIKCFYSGCTNVAQHGAMQPCI